jgi:hypothetical protein
MNLRLILFFGLLLLIACKDSNSPDISNIRVDVRVERFDKDFFSMDTTGIENGLRNLEVKYPSLYPIFIHNILGLEDSSRDKGVVRFISQNRFIADAADKEFRNAGELKKDLEQAFRYVKYYFPAYRVPKVATVVGPPDAFARNQAGELTTNFLTPEHLGILMQFYLGKDFSLYKDAYFISNIAPEYRSRRFDKGYLVADAMKLIADDIYPDKSIGKGLIGQMIEKGKQWWLLDKFLPETPDSVKTGYTKQQLRWCDANEGLIWNDIITTEKDLYTKDPMTLQNYIGEAPFTQSFGPPSPGNIGQWIGWQIVNKFVAKNPSMPVMEVLNTDARKIFEQAKYKPK